MVQIISIVLVSVAIIQSATSQSQFAQRVQLQSGTTIDPQHILANNGIYWPNLQQQSFNNVAESTCTIGIWIFYDAINFNEGQTNLAAVEWIFNPSYKCQDFVLLKDQVSSVKYAGSVTYYSKDTITLYQDMYFSGLEEFTSGDLPHLTLLTNVSSLIITGSSPWTLYDRPNFNGNSVCAFLPNSGNFQPAFITDTELISVPHRTVASVRLGCHNSSSL